MTTRSKKSKTSQSPSNILRNWYRGNFKSGLLSRPPIASLAALAFVVIFGGAGVYVYQATHAAGSPELVSAVNASGNWCLNNSSNSYAAENPVNTAQCDGRNSETFTVTGSGDTMHIKINSTHCIQPKEGSSVAGTIIVMDTCNGHPAQNWSRYQSGFKNPYASSQNTNKGILCLGVPNGNTGVPVRLEVCSTQPDQNWAAKTFTPQCGSGNHASADTAKCLAKLQLADRGWGSDQYDCLNSLYIQESGWRWNATNPSSGAYGIPQSLPANKMASAGSDWHDNANTQIKWGLGYIHDRYGTPCNAWAHEKTYGWYGILNNPNGTTSTF